jgi:hypothetical protein
MGGIDGHCDALPPEDASYVVPYRATGLPRRHGAGGNACSAKDCSTSCGNAALLPCLNNRWCPTAGGTGCNSSGAPLATPLGRGGLCWTTSRDGIKAVFRHRSKPGFCGHAGTLRRILPIPPLLLWRTQVWQDPASTDNARCMIWATSTPGGPRDLAGSPIRSTIVRSAANTSA